MIWEVVALALIFNLLSWIWFFAVRKAVVHVTKSYVKILGVDNRHMIFSTRLAAIRLTYMVAAIGLTIFSSYVLYSYL
jgi:hypothetical protein